MENKTTASYLVTAALAASLGYVGGLQGAGVPEVQARYKREPVVTNIPELTPAGKACFEGCLDEAVCPKVDMVLDLTGEHACNAAKHASSYNIQTHRGNTATDPEGVTTPAPDTMSLSGTSHHDMTQTPGRPPTTPPE